jgi:fibronectin-binding autotransporter adhesin
VGGDNANTAFSGTISMTNQGYNPTYGTFAKTGSGTLTIDNATITQGESYITQGAMAQTSGNTTVTYLAVGTGTTGGTPNVGALNVSGGTIRFGTGLQVGDFGGQGTLNQTGGTVRVDATCGDPAHCAALHIGNQGGTGTYNISGGELDLVGSNNELGRSTGTKPRSAGTLNISGTGVVDLSANGSLIIGYGNENTSPNRSQGLIDQTGGTLRVHSGSTLYLTGANSSSSVYNLTGGTLEIGGNSLKAGYGGTPNPYQFNLGGGTIKVIESALVTTVNATLASGVFTIDTNGLGATWSGVLSGTGGIAKAGAGTLQLSGNNSYAGGTFLTAGILKVTADNNLGASTGALTFNGGTLQFGSGFNTARSITLNGGTVDTNGFNTTFSGQINGPGSLAKTGAGVLTLSGNTNYSGATFINQGTVRAGAANAFSPNSAFTVASGATLDLNGFGQTIGSLAGVGSVTLGAAALTAGGDNTSTTFSGIMSGTGGLIKTGGGTLTLSGVNTYTGGTAINAGTLAVTTDANLGAVSSGLTFGGGTLQFLAGFTSNRGTTLSAGGGTLDTDGNSATLGGTIGGIGGVTKSGAGTLTLSGVNTYTGGTAINAGTLAVTTDANLGAAGSGLAFGGGTLQFLAGFASNRGTTLSAGGGTFDTNGNSATLGGTIGGVGGLTKSGAGTLTLSGASTYAGATNVNVGTLRAGATNTFSTNSAFTVAAGATLALNGFNQTIGSLAGVGNVTLGSATLTTGNDNTNTTFSGVISGTGGLVKIGTGTLTLTGANTYTGPTTVSAGMLQVGNGSNVGNIAGNGSFGIDRSDTYTFGGVISVTGSFVKAGTGKVILTGNNTYQGGTAINAGTLAVTTDANLGAASGGLAFSGGTLQFLSGFTSNRGTTLSAGGGTVDTNGNSATLGGTISGVGGLTKLGAGTLVLSAANTFSGGTMLAAGTLSLANNLALGTGALTTTGSVVDYIDGVTIANPIIVNSNTTQLQVTAGTATQAGVISELNGPRPIEKIGAGTLVLTGANTNSGLTTISAGTLVLGGGGTSGSILGNVVNNGSFAVNRSDAYTFSGAISGSGSFVQMGTGTTILSANSTYTGTTTVNAGTLIVNGSIANSAVTVNSGATLAGTGTVGATTILSGGTLAPGNSPGTITVAGNLAFQSGAIYLVQVTPSIASITNVTGTASLAGTVALRFSPGSFVRSYRILSAAGGLGGTTFNAVTTVNAPANFSTSLSYTAADVALNLTAVLGQGAGLSQNQQNVTTALNNFFNSGGTLPANFISIFNLSGASLGNALSQLSGEPATGAQQVGFQMESQFLNLMLDPFVDGRSGVGGAAGPALGFAPEREELPDDIALAYSSVLKAPPMKAPTFEQRWSVWGGAYGGGNRTSGDPAVFGSHDLSAATAGGAAGLDYRLAPGTVVGFALAGGGTNWGLAQGLGGGKSDAFQAGVYGTTRWGPAYLAAALAFTNHWMSTDRFAFAGDHLSASFNAQSFGGRVEGGYRFATIYGGLTPYAAIQSQTFHTPGYTEADLTSGGFALGFNSRNATDTRSELGGRFDRLLLLNPEAALTLRTRVAWAHDWISDPSLAALFQTLPGASFIVNGATPAKNSALASAGAELRLANGVVLLGKFDGEFASHSSTYAGTGTVRYTW